MTNMFTRMKLNTDAMIDEGFTKSIKFLVDEYIENDCPKSHYYSSFHEMLLEAYKLHLVGKLWSVGIEDRQRNYNGSMALDCWTDEPLKLELEELKKEHRQKLERLDKLERLVKKFNIDDKKLNEYLKD